jgi:hypothetical protein
VHLQAIGLDEAGGDLGHGGGIRHGMCSLTTGGAIAKGAAAEAAPSTRSTSGAPT